MTRRSRSIFAAWLAAVALACASGPGTAFPPSPVGGPVGRLEVRFATPRLEADLSEPAARRLRAVVRQSARDWLEQQARLVDADAPGALRVDVEIESLRVRSAAVAWLFAWAAPPDHVAARIRARRAGALVSEGTWRVESALAGWDWRDPEPRLERLARRLGRRIAQGL